MLRTQKATNNSSAPLKIEPSDFRLFLQNELVRRCQKNPKYSLRAFAKSLQMDFSTLAKILNGKRSFGPRTILKISQRLGLEPQMIQSFLKEPSKSISAQNNFNQLTQDTFKIISDWYHYAILELARVDSFKHNITWIAKSLGISTYEARAAIERLERAGIIKLDDNGKWVDQTGGRNTTVGNNFTAAAFRNLQKQVIEKALIALEETPFEKRDQSSMTMAIDSRKLPEAKEKIKKFRRELAQFLSRDEKRDQVYNLSVSLYPITNIPVSNVQAEV